MTSRNAAALLTRAWLAVFALAVLTPTRLVSGDTLKPYVLLIVDTSGSMESSTNQGPASCVGAGTSRVDHAKCAVQKVALSYAELILGLGIYRHSTTNSGGNITCGNAPNSTSCPRKATVCDTGGGNSGDSLDVLVPIYEGNTSQTYLFSDMACSGCSNGATNPEIFTAGGTPIAGSLAGAKRYFQGLDSPNFGPYASGLGDDPIRDDPYKDVFIGGEQCRPYIVIQLTDGGETCSGDPPAAATSLLSTVVDGKTYRIETKAIGFGIAPGDAAIEALAHAGGAANGSGNEGYYAQNEEELQLAISDIVAEAIKFELCNGTDDDCDGLADEDFTNLGDACDDGGVGVCKGTGVFVCSADGTGTTCEVSNPGLPPSAEVCDGLDNDCDGLIDEGGVCVGCGNPEVCNGIDDNCNGQIDENLTRSCGTDLGECVKGTETCSLGVWQGCTAITGSDEICDGLDNDCNGVADGFAAPCSELPGSNPGVGLCTEGTKICPVNGAGQFEACIGEIGPQTEICDGIDNDCDGLVDENTGGQACSATCGQGLTQCISGQLQCVGGSGTAEVCDGVDNDCDGEVDEGVPAGSACDEGGTICNGQEQCVSGSMECVGPPVGVEACNCIDDDCDGSTDENPETLCTGGATCVSCQCAFACAPGEFPCPLGRNCVNGFCLADACFGVTCGAQPNGDASICKDGDCVRACDEVTCAVTDVCVGSLGECRPNDCRTFPDLCTASEVCVGGVCEANTCAGIVCEGAQYCVDGTCVDSCAGVQCGKGKLCEKGQCIEHPCGGPCPRNEACNADAGVCVDDKCAGIVDSCDVGLSCNPLSGSCEPDVCDYIVCPGDGEVCRDGSCYYPTDIEPRQQRVTAAGHGCSATGTGRTSGATVLVALMVVGWLWRRRNVRPSARADFGVSLATAAAPRTAQLLVSVAVAAIVAGSATSCKVNEYCIDCEIASDAGIGDGPDAPLDAPGDGPDACTVTGNEICDGLDNDCDGNIDESDIGEPLPTVGEACSVEQGECQPGIWACENGALTCSGGVVATAEICDNKDNDCDGDTDEGNPGGGQVCGTDVGECVAGITQCTGGVLDCVGDVGTVGGVAESCDGKDNDCDGTADEGLTGLGTCGTTDVGECTFGTLACLGGVVVCQGAVGPAFELCDNLDQDCDGDNANGYDLDNNPLNCSACGFVCTLPHAVEGCSLGQCTVAGCDAGFVDLNLVASDGCEYACDFQGPFELCNGIDDNCDGTIDENVLLADVCESAGECAGTVPQCSNGAWTCPYPATVAVDANGDIIPETQCDTVDNDCDGEVDEFHPSLGEACNDGQLGVCMGMGTYQCAADPLAPVECVITVPGDAPSAETCNGKDDNCDGFTDNSTAGVAGNNGNLPGQSWVSIGNGVEVMKYEASRPDATADVQGIQSGTACSQSGVLPWTGVTHPQAEAACASMGARLCSEIEWHRACSVVSGQTFPAAQPGSGDGLILLEAENYFQMVPVTAGDGEVRAFVPDGAGNTYGGLTALRVSPNLGQSRTTTQALTQSTYVDYRLTLAQTPTYNVRIWLRMMGVTNNDDELYVALKAGTNPTFVAGDLFTVSDSRGDNQSTYMWYRSGAISVTGTGTYTLRIYMKEDGVKLDAIGITKNSDASAATALPGACADQATTCQLGNKFAYGTSPNTFNDQTCNGDGYDTDTGVGGDQDDILESGSLAQCFADWDGAGSSLHIFDMSGNVKEWTAERLPGVNPIRGGASNNIGDGTSCGLNFTSADDSYFFNNVGFRCCR